MRHIPSTSLVAGALVLASIPAHAQSSVTLYGITDVGIEYANHVPSGKTSSSAVRQQSGNLAGSRWGLKGAEDLGGGYKAIFVLEGGFNLNNGTLGQSGRLLAERRTWSLHALWNGNIGPPSEPALRVDVQI